MRVLVTGGREYTSYEDRMWLYAALSLLHSMDPILEIIEGGAQGFDQHARNWSLWRRGCGDIMKTTTVPAQWETHQRAAEAIRNTQMAQMKPDIVLACPGGDDTAHMIKVAKAHQLKVIFLEKMPIIKGLVSRPHEPSRALVQSSY